MIKSYIIFLRFFIFWIIFFFIERLIFLIYFSAQLRGVSLTEILSTFVHALRLDASMAGYLSAIPLLIYTVLLLFNKTIPALAGRIYVSVLIIFFSIVAIGNVNIYREWGSKINYRVVDLVFNSPKEVIASSSSAPVFLSVTLILGIILAGLLISRKLIRYRIADIRKPLLTKIGGSLLALGLTFLLIRGGWQLSPINQSMSYFSGTNTLNHAAVNTHWNLMQDILNSKYGTDNPYKYFSPEQSQQIVKELFKQPDGQVPSILTTKQPNIVLIIAESFSARLIGVLGGEKDVTPHVNELSREGLLFTQVYASAGRTDKGVVATLSAFPSQAIQSVMKLNDKQEKLPAIAQELRAAGYRTSFYYGGESEFFNMKSYIMSHGYDKLVDQHAFLKKDMNSKWGAYDDKVFSKNLSDLSREKQPFFSTILTLTNHEPFELPVEAHFKGDDIDNLLRSTTYYTDSSIAAYLKDAKKSDWYKNTLFVIISDHSHRAPGNLSAFDPDRYHIPLLFYGDVIRPEFRGMRIEKTGSQTDLAATLLNQLDLNTGRYPWSKDLLNPEVREFAFFNWDNGFGFVTPQQAISFDNVGKNIIQKKDPNSDPEEDKVLLDYGKAYMQKVFQEYLEL